jgi:EmrB/QacA subfamily drug resistance transporter
MSADAVSVGRRAAPELSRLGRIATVGSLAVGTYMSALDNSIVNAVLPVVAEAFHTDLSAVEWVVTTYLLTQGALMLTFGRLGDLWGHKRVYMVGLVAFVTSSLLCGAAPSTPFLVAARALQAVGASMVVSNMAAIMTRVFPPEQRGRALGTQATTVYLGVATGAPLGGWLTGVLGWRSVFYVNIPFGLLALFLAWRVIKADPLENRRETFDFVGAAVYAAGLVVLLLGLNQGTSWGWVSPWTLGCLGLGVVILGSWVALELRMANPMLDLRLFKQRTFSTPVVSSMLNYGATVSTTFLLPFALIQGRELTPAQTGLVLMCQPIVMAIAASFSGALSDKIGSRIPATVGMATLAVGLFLLSRFVPTVPIPMIAATLVITGLGIGLFTSPNNSAVMGAVPQRRRGVASGIISTARTLGNLLGIGLAGAVFSTVLARTDGGPDAIVHAASIGLLVASGIALVGAVTSVTRPAPLID